MSVINSPLQLFADIC